MTDAAVLDGLVWAQLAEKARVARIAAALVRTTSKYCKSVTKKAIQDAVKETLPPHGRGKAICEAVAKEIERQQPIYFKREEEQREWRQHLEHQAKLATRLDVAYAARFGRPVYLPTASYPGVYSEEDYWEKQEKWRKEEAARDKGDSCIGLLIYREVYTVALLESGHHLPYGHHIAVKNRNGGEAVYTSLKKSCANFVEAAASLGGPKVRNAIAQGYHVHTDWSARTSTIHYPDGKVISLEWQVGHSDR